VLSPSLFFVLSKK